MHFLINMRLIYYIITLRYRLRDRFTTSSWFDMIIEGKFTQSGTQLLIPSSSSRSNRVLCAFTPGGRPFVDPESKGEVSSPGESNLNTIAVTAGGWLHSNKRLIRAMYTWMGGVPRLHKDENVRAHPFVHTPCADRPLQRATQEILFSPLLTAKFYSRSRIKSVKRVSRFLSWISVVLFIARYMWELKSKLRKKYKIWYFQYYSHYYMFISYFIIYWIFFSIILKT